MSDDTLDNDEIDCLCSVLDMVTLPNNEGEVTDKNVTLELLKTKCQELLLRLHPDKNSLHDRDQVFNKKDSDHSEFGRILKAWKLLSKYSPEANNDFLIRQLLARQHQLKEQHLTSTTSKPLWKTIPLKDFALSGKI